MSKPYCHSTPSTEWFYKSLGIAYVGCINRKNPDNSFSVVPNDYEYVEMSLLVKPFFQTVGHKRGVRALEIDSCCVNESGVLARSSSWETISYQVRMYTLLGAHGRDPNIAHMTQNYEVTKLRKWAFQESQHFIFNPDSVNQKSLSFHHPYWPHFVSEMQCSLCGGLGKVPAICSRR